MSGGLISGGRMSGGRLSGGLVLRPIRPAVAFVPLLSYDCCRFQLKIALNVH